MKIEDPTSIKALRHKTAIRRFAYSKPIAAALSLGLVNAETTVFDYGCGLGGDVRLLQERGIQAAGWDPHHLPTVEIQPADLVNLGYVLNVIEEPGERLRTLVEAFRLAKRALLVSVRVDQTLESNVLYEDGLLTTRGSFQKIYSQSEFREYVESTLGTKTHVIGLGMVVVFKDEGAEARFSAEKAFRRVASYQRQAVAEFEAHPLGRKFIGMMASLGRAPLGAEFSEYGELLDRFGSRNRIERIAWKAVHPATVEETQKLRREEVLVSLAMVRLQRSKPIPLRSLPADVQADIKVFWPSYQGALRESESFLFGMGSPEIVKQSCARVKFGKLLPEDLYVHVTQDYQLPPLLRLIIFAARQIVGDVECDLIKTSIDGRKVSFLKYRDFDASPHPELQQSIRVYLPKATHSFRDYSDSSNPPLLHRKEAFLDELHPDYTRCAELTRREEEAGLLSRSDIGFRNGWRAALQEKGLSLRGFELIELPPQSDL